MRKSSKSEFGRAEFRSGQSARSRIEESTSRTIWPNQRRGLMLAATLVFVSLIAVGPLPQTLSFSDDLEYLDLGKSRLALVKIRPGKFLMGTDEVIRADDYWKPCSTCPPRNEDEGPVHQVTISEGFWLGQYPVTQRQWQEVMGNNPSNVSDLEPDAPVNQVSWEDTQNFIAKVNALQRQWMIRLPTEAEWEYAARAGTSTETYGPLDDVAWYKGNNTGRTHPVGKRLPNAFGVYDMLGNVWQWCDDWFGLYTTSPSVDPKGPPDGDRRVTRGGCFYCDAIHERAARRNRDLPTHRSRSIGFRIVAIPRR